MLLYLDLETRSTIPITAGLYRYAEQVEVLLFAYAIDNEPAKVWDVISGEKAPPELRQAYKNAEKVIVHNSAFERIVLSKVLPSKPLEAHRIIDTMARAQQHSLPGSLDALCNLFKIDAQHAKSKEGKDLIKVFCVPPYVQPAERPRDWEKFKDYARLDVEAMRQIYKKMPSWNDERELFALDQKINDTGLPVDVDFVEKIMELLDTEKSRLSKATKSATSGFVDSATQTKAILDYLNIDCGLPIDNVRASTLERLLESDISASAAEVIRLRLASSTSSTAKYKAVAQSVSSDGRLRGTLNFCGASRTGRWSGRRFQPQNLPRPSGIYKNPEVLDMDIEAVERGESELFVSDLMHFGSCALRSLIVAPEGKNLVVADYSNIEGRIAAWLAGETWKIEAFNAADRGEGADIYKLAYARSFGVKPEDVTDQQRQVGKVQELALGYGGGVGSFASFADIYRIDLMDLYDSAWKSIPAEQKGKSLDMYDWAVKEKRTYDMAKECYIICDAIKSLWRASHPRITAYWRTLEESFTNCLHVPDEQRAKMLRLSRVGVWVRIQLPSGRFLCYPIARNDGGLSYMGIDPITRKWSRIRTYGAKIFENVCQATARDIMAAGMLNLQNEEILLTVHDELVVGTTKSTEHILAGMLDMPGWASGLPLAAGGFRTQRYRKGDSDVVKYV
jgi:DNA polymerase